MNLIAGASSLVERAPLPDGLIRLGIRRLVAHSARHLGEGDAAAAEARFATTMGEHAIAEFTDKANDQHYELPPAFFHLILGPRRKYSCCLYENGADTLAAAEEQALAVTAAHAGLIDGQSILELGCGWGSLSLWLAEHFPRSEITALSNSASQRYDIKATAAQRGLRNLRIITADVAGFDPGRRFDRIVSVEMFEHVANWPALLGRARSWLNPDGRLFLHVFSHRAVPYRFDHDDPADWIAQHFFTGGIMPSHGLIARCGEAFTVEEEWRWSGAHYERTALDWLANFDRNGAEIDAILEDVYGKDGALWRRRWRIFFLATAGLFGYSGGAEWGVSHYRLRPAADA